jgi:hypothetical protein
MQKLKWPKVDAFQAEQYDLLQMQSACKLNFLKIMVKVCEELYKLT